MDEYKLIINEMFARLDAVDAPRKDFDCALAAVYIRAKERLEEENINPYKLDIDELME